ncbi:MAG: hypothetical protein AAF488_08750 [Planctomycetota bacterium]
MTFSDKRIVDLINKNFTAVWESVSPVKTATFDLGNGRSVKGTVGGEIAIYFCRPDGGVFDVLPALQSPAVTHQAIESALEFYRETEATLAATRNHHGSQMKHYDWHGNEIDLTSDWANMPHKEVLEYRQSKGDEGTAVMAEMLLSKSGMVTPSESVVVVEPGGLDLYRRPIQHAFAATGEFRTPKEWTPYVFEYVLNQKLEGGDYHFDSTSLAPFSIGQ